eukprot:380094_1
MSSTSTQLKVKVILETDIRGWKYPNTDTKFRALQQFVSTTFGINSFLLQFTDEEGDRLTIANEHDLCEAFNLSIKQFRRSLKIFIITNEIKKAPKPKQKQKQKHKLVPTKK